MREPSTKTVIMSVRWQLLVPPKPSDPDSPFKVLYHEKSNKIFAITPSWFSHVKYDPDFGPPTLSQYSFVTDSWKDYKIQPTSDSFYLHCWNPAAINSDGNIIYLCNKEGQIIMFKLIDNDKCELKIIKNLGKEMNFVATKAQAIVIKNEFHVIGSGVRGYKHVKFNPNKNKCDVLHDLENIFNYKHLLPRPIIRRTAMTKIANKLLVFGGYDSLYKYDRIHEYNINNNQWKTLETKIPKFIYPHCGKVCVQILNGQIVLLFGKRDSNHIFIYYVCDKIFQKSKVECPNKYDTYQVLATNDKIKDSLTTFGYIRKQWKQCGINNFLFPPQYLIRMICDYYMNVWIHLFTNRFKKHFKINAFDIINDCSSVTKCLYASLFAS